MKRLRAWLNTPVLTIEREINFRRETVLKVTMGDFIILVVTAGLIVLNIELLVR